jgi:hypothetical protein
MMYQVREKLTDNLTGTSICLQLESFLGSNLKIRTNLVLTQWYSGVD